MEPVLLSLVRGIIFASHEDMIPEFRAYNDYLDQWGQHKNRPADNVGWLDFTHGLTFANAIHQQRINRLSQDSDVSLDWQPLPPGCLFVVRVQPG